MLDAGPTERAASHVNAGWIVPTLAEPVPSPGLIATSLRWMLRSDSPLYIRPRLDPAFLRWTLRFWRHCNARDFLTGTEAIAAFGARSLALYDAMREAGVGYEEHRDGYSSPTAYRGPRSRLRRAGAGPPFRIRDLADHERGRIARPGAVALGDGHWRLLAAAGALSAARYAGARAERHLQEHGVEVRRDTPVSGIETNDGKATAVFAAGERIPAETVVVAAGAWTPRLLKPLRVNVPIKAGKGYSIDLAPASPAQPVRRPLYLHETRVTITPLDDMIRLAGTMELSGLNHDVRQERVAAIARSAAWAIRGWPERTPTSGPGVRVWTRTAADDSRWPAGHRPDCRGTVT